MKVIFGEDRHFYPKGGRKEGSVFCYYHGGEICILRRYVEVPSLPQHEGIRKIHQLALSLWKEVPDRMKNDFLHYSRLYKVKYGRLRSRYLNRFSLFLKLVHRIHSQIQGDVEISDLRETLFSYLYKGSLADYIRLGFLPRIRGYYRFNAVMGCNVVVGPSGLFSCLENFEDIIGVCLPLTALTPRRRE